MSCYSDFPFQEDYPNFMNQEKFWNYLQEFAEHFDLLKYIRFRVRQLGLWEVNAWELPIQQSNGKGILSKFIPDFISV